MSNSNSPEIFMTPLFLAIKDTHPICYNQNLVKYLMYQNMSCPCKDILCNIF